MLDVGHRAPREIAGPLGKDRGHGGLKAVWRKPSSFSVLLWRDAGSGVAGAAAGWGLAVCLVGGVLGATRSRIE